MNETPHDLAAVDPAIAAALEDDPDDLFENAPCGYLSTLPDGTIVKVNRTFLTWTGYRRADVVGRRTFRTLLTPGGQIYYETHLAPLLSMQGSVREIALELVGTDRRRLPVLLNAVVKRDADGRALVTRITVFNATDRRRYERELMRARRDAERSEARVRVLARLSREIAEPPGLAARARRSVDVLAEELGGWVCLDVAVGRPGRITARAARAPEAYTRLADHPEFGPGAPLLSRAATGASEPVVTTADPTGGGPPGVPSWAVLPLTARGRGLGSLVVVPAPDAPFGDADLPFLVDIAARVAAGLENARLYEQERDNALILQRSLLAGDLPRDPRAPLVTRYRPAVRTLEVGGDWYDAFRLGPDRAGADRIGVVVGDVVGRGIEAASAMGQLRSAVRAVASGDVGPARLLQRLDLFVERLPQARMATVAYAEVTPATGLVRFACAGHPPPVAIGPDGEPRLLWSGRSAPLGARVQVVARPDAETVLAAGSRLLLYTDGLVERRGESIDAGLTRLVAELGRRRDVPVAVMVDGVIDVLLGDRPADDDVCVLCVSVGVARVFERTVPARAQALAPLREDLRAWLVGHGVGELDRDAIVLGCSEAVGNAVEHGYRDAEPGPVRVRATASDRAVELEVTDRGVWRAPEPDARPGRGLELMRRMMEQVTVEPDRTTAAHGTRVSMRRRRTDREVTR